MQKDDVILNKCAAIERCVKRVLQEYSLHSIDWRQNFTVQDSIILNLQRACEASIDLANYVVKKYKLGIPQNSRDSFDFLAEAKLINPGLSERMKHMVGFRNIAVHEYQSLDLNIIEGVIKNNLSDFSEFTSVMITSKDL